MWSDPGGKRAANNQPVPPKPLSTPLPPPGTGAAAYLDVVAVVAAATGAGCDMLHPGYGFASERPELAARCAEAGLRSPAPRPARSRCSATGARPGPGRASLGARLPGTDRDTSLEEARALLHEHGAVMIKAIAGGGGRGVRPISPGRCAGARRRPRRAFGNARSRIYVEQLLTRARHVEVQVTEHNAVLPCANGEQVSQRTWTLATTLLDHTAAPAGQIREAYLARWPASETTFGQDKDTITGALAPYSGPVLRSGTPSAGRAEAF